MGVEFSRTTVLSLLDQIKAQQDDELSKYRVEVLSGSIFKKFIDSQYDVAALEAAAFRQFLDDNQSLLQVDLDSSLQIVRYVKYEMEALFSEPFSLYECANLGYCGPGSSVSSGDTDFFSKMFDSPLTHTGNLYRFYKESLSASWYLADSLRHQQHGTVAIPGSNLCSVPKDDKRRRVICTEPTLNMFFQLGAKLHMDRALLTRHNIDMSKQQDINRRMAREGSRSQRFVTLDLKNASDRISLEVCKKIVPTWLLDILVLLRSPKTKVNGVYHDLNMISSMGNGTTFPLMTAIISCIIRSVYALHNIHPTNGRNYAVFGDDIICVADLANEVIESLELFGFIVNTDKSFLTGHFRESCGGDYLKGYDVRGVYIKHLDCDSDYFVAYNLLLRWGCKHGIDVSPVLLYLLGSVRKVRLIPGDENPDGGIYAPYEYSDSAGNGIRKYTVLTPSPLKRDVVDFTNERGCVISFVGGYITGYRSRKRIGDAYIMSRQQHVRYKVRRKVTPNWNLVNDFTLGWFNNQEFSFFSKKVLTDLLRMRLESLLQ